MIVVAQCRLTDNPSASKAVDDAVDAKSHWPDLAEFVLMTSAERDARLYDEFQAEMLERCPGVRGVVCFWDDIVGEIAADPALVRKHWGAFPQVSRQPIRRVRDPAKVPQKIPLVTSGGQLLSLAFGSDGCYPNFSDGLTAHEAELVGSFIQSVCDWSDLASDLLPGAQVRAATSLQEELDEIRAAGFLVFAAHEPQRIEGGDLPARPLTVLHLYVLRASDAAIRFEETK